MIISHAHKFIFLKTQKCAGTSVELALSRHCGPDDVITRVAPEDEKLRDGRGPQNEDIPIRYRVPGWQFKSVLGMRASKAGIRYFNHMGATAVRRSMDSALFDAYRKVTVVRNPWDREVSLYYWTYRDQSQPPSFDRFVRRWKTASERKNFDLYSIDGRVVADVILRYEHLQDDFTAFLQSLGITHGTELPRAKSKQRKKTRDGYRAMYSTELNAIVAKRYAREIEAFSYEF